MEGTSTTFLGTSSTTFGDLTQTSLDIIGQHRHRRRCGRTIPMLAGNAHVMPSTKTPHLSSSSACLFSMGRQSQRLVHRLSSAGGSPAPHALHARRSRHIAGRALVLPQKTIASVARRHSSLVSLLVSHRSSSLKLFIFAFLGSLFHLSTSHPHYTGLHHTYIVVYTT